MTFTTEMIVTDFYTGEEKLVEGPDIIAMSYEDAELYLLTMEMTWCRINGERRNEGKVLKLINVN